MRVYAIGRRVIHAFIYVFSFVLLGISANLVTLGNKYGLSLDWADLALAVSVLTLLCLIPTWILDRMRTNAVLSWTAVELAWNGVLWVLWLASAAYTTSKESAIDCSSNSYDVLVLSYYLKSKSSGLSVCQQTQAVMALAWLNWILMGALFVWLLVVALIAHSSGHSQIWRESASDFQPAKNELPMTQTGAGTGYGQQNAAPQAGYGYPTGLPPQAAMGLPQAGSPATTTTYAPTGPTQGYPTQGVAQV